MNRYFLPLIATLLLFSGCVTRNELHGYIPEKAVKSIAPVSGQDNEDSVREKYGAPTLISQTDPRSWFYVEERQVQRPLTRMKAYARRITLVRFNAQGVVAQTREITLDEAVRVAFDSTYTPTAGRKVSFIDQLLANVGRSPLGLPVGN